MQAVSMFEAKTNLSKYVAAVAGREEPFVIIVRNGTPVAKIIPYENDVGNRIGAAKGHLPPMPSLEEFNSVDVSSDFCGDGGLL